MNPSKEQLLLEIATLQTRLRHLEEELAALESRDSSNKAHRQTEKLQGAGQESAAAPETISWEEVRDVTERRPAEAALRLSNQRLNLLAESASRLLASEDPQTVVNTICTKVMQFLDCDVFFNFIQDEPEGRLHLNAWAGIPAEEAERIEWLDLGVAVCGCAARDGGRLVAEDIQAGADIRTELVKSYGIQAYACHPLLAQGRVLGALSFGTRRRHRFSEDELALMQAVADQVAIALERQQAQKALRLMNAELQQRVEEGTAPLASVYGQLDAFFTHSINPMVFLDKNFNFIKVNKAYTNACQRPVEDFPGHNHFELYPNAENQTIFAEVVRTKKPYLALAKPFKFPDHPEWGVTYWDWTLMPILNENNQVDFLVFSLNDVTERYRAEEAMTRQASLVQDLYNNAPCGYHSLDPEGRFVLINDTELAWLGYSREEVVGRLHFTDLLTPDGQKAFRQNFPAFLAKGEVHDLEYQLIRRDGTLFPVLLNATAIKDEAGNYLLSRATVFDITARVQAEAALARERQRLFQVLEQLPAYVVLLTPDYTVAYANRKFTQSFGVAEAGQRCYEFLFQRNTPCEHCQTFRALETNTSQEWEWQGPDGRTYAVFDYPFTDVDGSSLILELGLDITARQQAEQALRDSEERLHFLANQLLTSQEQERKRLAAELHDELGHALLTLKLSLSGVYRKLLPEQENLKELVQEQVNYIGHVITEVRRLYYDLSPGDLEDLGLTKALKNLIEDFGSHQPEVSFQVDLPELTGGFNLPVQTTIYRLVQEALTNIGKYAEPTRVTVSARRENGSLRLVIADDGQGFDPSEVHRDPDRGLGLAAMRERLYIFGGSLDIWSRKGEGTRLTFTIPTLKHAEKRD